MACWLTGGDCVDRGQTIWSALEWFLLDNRRLEGIDAAGVARRASRRESTQLPELGT